MKIPSPCLGVLLLALMVHPARATNISFDGIPLFSQVGNFYAPLGVHFALTDFGVQEGLANGDAGNWQLNGTSGPYFDGFNGADGTTYSMTVTLDQPVNSFSMDASRSSGSSPTDTLTLSGYDGATLVDSETVTFGAINTWTTLSLTGTMDEIVWTGNGTSFHPYGVDNLNYSAVPEPSTLALLLAGGVVVFSSKKSAARTRREIVSRGAGDGLKSKPFPAGGG